MTKDWMKNGYRGDLAGMMQLVGKSKRDLTNDGRAWKG